MNNNQLIKLFTNVRTDLVNKYWLRKSNNIYYEVSFTIYICVLIKSYIKDVYKVGYYMPSQISELLNKYKPEYTIGYAWFEDSIEGIKSRINILDKILYDLKYELNENV